MKKLITIGLDIDDTLYEGIPHCIRMAERERNFFPPLDEEEFTRWGSITERTDYALSFFQKREFYETQPVLPGAKQFVHELSKSAEIYIFTACEPEFMGIRCGRILDDFPEIKKENIIMAANKQLLNVDFLLDDGAHNITGSNAAYPVLFRKPWNQGMTGLLSVNSYEEFLQLFAQIMSPHPVSDKYAPLICLVGPSGSGKTKLAEQLVNTGGFARPKSYTTAERPSKLYNCVSPEEFCHMKREGVFFETTVYAGNHYGMKIESVYPVLSNGKTPVLVLDICGAIALKKHFPGTKIFYMKRDKRELVSSIIRRNIPEEEKINRIISLESEKKNEEICDTVLYYEQDNVKIIQQMLKEGN